MTNTQTYCYKTDGRTSLEEGSACRRSPPDNTKHSQETYIHSSYGIETHNPSKQSTADPHVRPLDHWDRRYSKFIASYYLIYLLLPSVKWIQHNIKAIHWPPVINSDRCALRNIVTCSDNNAIFCWQSNTYPCLVPSSWLIWATLLHSIREWRRCLREHLRVDLVLEWQDELKQNLTFTFSIKLVSLFVGKSIVLLNISGIEGALAGLLCWEYLFW